MILSLWCSGRRCAVITRRALELGPWPQSRSRGNPEPSLRLQPMCKPSSHASTSALSQHWFVMSDSPALKHICAVRFCKVSITEVIQLLLSTTTAAMVFPSEIEPPDGQDEAFLPQKVDYRHHFRRAIFHQQTLSRTIEQARDLTTSSKHGDTLNTAELDEI